MTDKTDPKTDPAADPEAERVKSLDERFGKIETEQAEHRGMLEKILDRLPGGETKADPTAAGASGPDATSHTVTDIQGTVRREIAEANERAAAEARAKGDAEWRKSVDDVLETVKAEKAPREPQTGVKGKMQRAMFGADR